MYSKKLIYDYIIGNDIEKENNVETGENIQNESLKTPEKMSKNKKIPLLILLFVLLILDIAALVIYIIGIDKVFSFIK